MEMISKVMAQSMNTGSEFIDQRVLAHYCCLNCQSEVKEIETVIPFGPKKGQKVSGKHGCNCEVLADIRREQKENLKLRTQRIFDENSLVNESLKRATFDTFTGHEFADKKRKALAYVEDFHPTESGNLFLQGTFGTGKSHLSMAISKALVKRGYTSIFISLPKLLTKIRSTYNDQSEYTEDSLKRAIKDVDLVVFDDIGAEGEPNNWAYQNLFEIIDSRAGKTNIYTTNLSAREFESSKKMGRIFSRLLDESELVIMNGTDYRRKQFKKED